MDAFRAWSTASPLGGDSEVLRVVAEVSGRPEFQRYRSGRHASLQRLFDELAGWLGELSGLRQSSPFAFWLILLALLALQSLLVVHIVYSLRAALRPPVAAPPAALPPPVGFAERASDLARQGAHLQAAHLLLLATLEQLAVRRFVVLNAHDGNRRVCEALEQSRLGEALRRRLVALIGETEAAWFGQRPAGEPLYRRWVEALAEIGRVP